MKVGERIKERIEELGISQSELARRVHLDASTINGLVNGTSRSSAHLHNIAKALNTTADYLTGESNNPATAAPLFEFDSDERRWVECLRELDGADRSAILRVTRSLARAANDQGDGGGTTFHAPKREYRGE